MLSWRPSLIWLVPLAVLAFAIDQASKAYVLYGLGMVPGMVVDVVPPLLRFKFAWNTGINFGLFNGGNATSQWPMIILGLVISLGVLIWIWRQHRTPLVLAATGLLIGGALGNIYDRIVHGAVVDFLNMSCCGITNPFAFNIADVFVFAGAIGLILFVREPEKGEGVDG